MPELHRRAAIWLNENQQPAPAIQHALAANNHALSLQIIWRWLDAREQANQFLQQARQTAQPDNAFEQLQLSFYQGINSLRCGVPQAVDA